MTALCRCGCGRATQIARRGNRHAHAGEPLPYIRGHERHVPTPQQGCGRMWVVTDKGKRELASIRAGRAA